MLFLDVSQLLTQYLTCSRYPMNNCPKIKWINGSIIYPVNFRPPCQSHQVLFHPFRKYFRPNPSAAMAFAQVFFCLDYYSGLLTLLSLSLSTLCSNLSSIPDMTKLAAHTHNLFDPEEFLKIIQVTSLLFKIKKFQIKFWLSTWL